LRKSSTVRRYTVSKSSTTRNLAAVILAMILAETNNAKIAAVIDITTVIVRLLTNIKSVRVTSTNARGTSQSTPKEEFQ
jgi:hypothetical protein